MDNIARKERKAARRARRRSEGSVLGGIILLIVGGALLMRQLNYDLPAWLFTWPMIVIVVGIFIGAVNRFRDMGFLVICAVGFFFLADDIWPGINVKNFILPAVIIFIGLTLLFLPRWGGGSRVWNVKTTTEDETGTVERFRPSDKAIKEDIIDVAAVFGAVKKNFYSKTFKGGEMVCVFGGVQIDLSQADFEEKVVIESVQIFGGATLIVPPTWEVRSEAVAIFGGIEDKRKQVIPQTPRKVLVLDGFVMFGGIEIKSY